MKRRLIIAADKSGSGKTTVTCGLIYALKKRGLKLKTFKCGPDYIDPMFHREVLGVPSGNLDSFFVSEDMLRYLYNEGSKGADISLIEGVMGYYDGLGGVSTLASTWEIADIIDTPTVLVMDCKGASVSVSALVRGMLDFPDYLETGRTRDSRIRGVILNRVSPMFYDRLRGLLEESCPEIKVLGYMPDMPEYQVPSRHLGLVEPQDIEGFKQWAESVGEQLEKTVDIDELLKLSVADSIDHEIPDNLSALKLDIPVRLLIAQDEAFTFYYQENRELLTRMGAQLIPFSPLHDDSLPEDIDGIILGGGYPELYGSALAANVSLLSSLASLIRSGVPLIAECGGYMYLNKMLQDDADKSEYEMCGVFDGTARKQDRLVRFGYVVAETKKAGVFGAPGTVLKGHEFHRYDCDFNGDGYLIKKPSAGSGKAKTKERCYSGIFYDMTMSAGWPHFYYYSNPEAVFNFLKRCERYHIERLSQLKWDNIGKPIDSLGVLEKHVVKLCGIQRTLEPHIGKRALVVLCGDHGCVREGVTQTDSSVTRKVAESFARGTMTTSYFARDNHVDVYTIDVGMMGERYTDSTNIGCSQSGLSDKEHAHPGRSDNPSAASSDAISGLRINTVNDRRLQDGTGDIAIEPAMDMETGRKALQLGRNIVHELKSKGYDIIATGEMGIGNTTPTAALLAFYLGLNAEDTVGYGAGLSEDGLSRKKDVVYRALTRLSKIIERDGCEYDLSQAEHSDSDKGEYRKLNLEEISRDIAETALFEIGGLEIAVMAGMFLGAVEEEMPILIDGIISTAAALSACMMDERVEAYAFASHISGERAARLALDKMGLRAIIDADMSLGEGSGAVLLLPLITAAINVYNEMGTFSDIDVGAYHRFK